MSTEPKRKISDLDMAMHMAKSFAVAAVSADREKSPEEIWRTMHRPSRQRYLDAARYMKTALGLD